MKQMLSILFLTLLTQGLWAQALETLTLEQSYELSMANYPSIKQRELIAKSEAYSISNAVKGAWPVIGIYGQESYQSDVTKIPIRSPEMNIEPLSKHQYKIYGEVAANLYDGR